MVDDDFVVGGQTKVKLNPIVEANGMAKAFEGVLWRLLPHVPHWREMEPITFDLLHVFRELTQTSSTPSRRHNT